MRDNRIWLNRGMDYLQNRRWRMKTITEVHLSSRKGTRTLPSGSNKKYMKLKIEIIYYKILGHIICLCPIKKAKKRLLEYANKRFPTVEEENERIHTSRM